ncbi:MAG TPA: phage Gp37/Gp68 family protein [Vicinamibacterales bacterium]|nr:phage Gp37/Gp68 family protein [Vicinamibacterales bacterium]
MSDGSAIEWTDATWNPVRGCTKVSPGCKFCYAESIAERFRGVPGHPFEQGFDLLLVHDKLDQPLAWRRPRKVFVNSMSDLFHDGVPVAYISAVGETMLRANWHIYQILTKRHQRLRRLLRTDLAWLGRLPHVWFGVSVENRKHGIPRIAALRETPAAVRFLSIEPLLEDLGPVDLTGIDWVIVGGESGPHARPMQKEWVVNVHRQCASQGVPFFFKQWGGVRKHLTGRMLDGRTYDEFPSLRPSIPPRSSCQDPRIPIRTTG